MISYLSLLFIVTTMNDDQIKTNKTAEIPIAYIHSQNMGLSGSRTRDL